MRHLPPSSQVEYESLLKKLNELEEKKKMIKEKSSNNQRKSQLVANKSINSSSSIKPTDAVLKTVSAVKNNESVPVKSGRRVIRSGSSFVIQAGVNITPEEGEESLKSIIYSEKRTESELSKWLEEKSNVVLKDPKESLSEGSVPFSSTAEKSSSGTTQPKNGIILEKNSGNNAETSQNNYPRKDNSSKTVPVNTAGAVKSKSLPDFEKSTKSHQENSSDNQKINKAVPQKNARIVLQKSASVPQKNSGIVLPKSGNVLQKSGSANSLKGKIIPANNASKPMMSLEAKKAAHSKISAPQSSPKSGLTNGSRPNIIQIVPLKTMPIQSRIAPTNPQKVQIKNAPKGNQTIPIKSTATIPQKRNLLEPNKTNPVLQNKTNPTAPQKRKLITSKSAVAAKVKKTGTEQKIQHYLNKISNLVPDAQKRLIEKSESNYKNER